jgi:cell division protein FtsI/penicillin-binding protein 2
MMRKMIVSLAILTFLSVLPTTGAQTLSADKALQQALQGTPAIAIVLDTDNDHVLATVRPRETSSRLSTPGSVLKPFFLRYALEHRLIGPQATIFCKKALVIAGRNLACTHPQDQVAFDAEQALAYSCNRYFAELAQRFPPEQLMDVSNEYQFSTPPHLFPAEAQGKLRIPATTEQAELFVLGMEGIQITPAQIASAYRKLALQLKNAPASSPSHPVLLGLEDSVQYAMANNAQVPGLLIAGKTGTASDAGQSWTHGWFAGFAPAESPKVVVVVYLPRGNGADAARLAQSFFRSYKGNLIP